MLLVKKKIAMQLYLPATCSGPTKSYLSLLSNKELEPFFDLCPVFYTNEEKSNGISESQFYEKSFKDINPDLIVFAGAGPDSLRAIKAAKKSVNCIRLVGIHGLYSETCFYPFIKKEVSRLIIEPEILRSCDFFYTVYKNASNKLFNRFRSKSLGYLYNTVPDWNLDNKKEIKLNFREEHSIAADQCLITYCGRISEEKGMVYLAKAIRQYLSTSAARVVFQIIGDGPYLAMMKSILAEETLSGSVRFLGSLTEPRDAIFASDIFIFPSLHENLPVSILEASAAGLFIITTPVGGIPEEVLEGINAIYITPGSVESIVKTVEYVVGDQIYKRLDDQSWKAFGEKFSKKAVGLKALEIFNSCFARKNSD
jgi:glycosyltransferase involved in cell wall biosynthesis